jgi:hypothetical protein
MNAKHTVNTKNTARAVHPSDHDRSTANPGRNATRLRVPATPAHRDWGQATTEYALVLLAAALVGLLVVGWATSGGGAAAIGRLFERVIESVIDKV